MDISIFNYIKEKTKKFEHNSLQYTDYDDIEDYEIICDNDKLLIVYGFMSKFNMYQIHWAASEAEFLIDFIKQLNKEIFISFVPNQWMDLFKNNNFIEFALLRDYWMNNLESIPNCDKYIKLTFDECEEASKLTMLCKDQSREFFGETKQWFEEWISGDTSADSDYKDNCVLIHKENNCIAGIVCVATYGHDSPRGTVVWIRELAVNPKFQGRGIGRKLLIQALNYGKENGAVRSFLMADDCNANAINLYKNVGFIPSEEVGQLDMIYKINCEVK